MKYEFNRVVDGTLKYIDNNIYAGMNDLQEVAARIVVGRIVGNKDNIKELLMTNGFAKTFAIIDSEGMVDDEILAEIKREIAKKGKISFSIPMFGTMTFTPSDVDALHKYIAGEGVNNEIN